MHRLLERQIKRVLGLSPERWPQMEEKLRQCADLTADEDPELARALFGLPDLMARVSEAYAQQDRDVALVRRSLELSSEELTTANQKLRLEAEASSQALATLQQAFDATHAGQQAAPGQGSDLVAMAQQLANLTREQERMRRALSESEERFNLAMQGANDGLWDYDLVANSVYYSPRWKAMLGAGEQEIGNSPEVWRNRLHPDDLEATEKALADHLEGRSPSFETTVRLRPRQGHYLWVLTRGLAVRNPGGKAIRVVGTISDITKRVELEHYLAQYKAAIDKHAIVSITDVQGNITYANGKFSEISGYSREEVLGKNHRMVKSGHHPDSFYAEMWQTISSGNTWSGEICNRAKNGHLYWVLSTIAPVLDDEGRPFQYISIRADITENKRHEEELRRAKETAETANKTKSEFLANMSHEIRTPMNGVLGMLDLALDTPLNDELKEYLGLAHSSAHALLSILNDILDFSKIEAGRLDVHPEPMDPRALLDELARLNEPRCAEKGLKFHLIESPDLPGKIVADPIRLRQVLVNLISNALKFTHQGAISLEAHLENHFVRFTVKDTGIGIAPEKQSSVFDAFTQADGSITKRFGGTGLGLTICSRLIRLMGGTMGLHSELNQGSAFYFTLPTDPALLVPAQPLPPTWHESPPPSRLEAVGTDSSVRNAQPVSLRILLVEDNPINQKLTVALLEKAGHRIDIAADGYAAVEAATNSDYDLVLMDMHMPGMDGLEASRRIRVLEGRRSQVPIVALTANAYSEDRERCLNAGMNGYVAKPIRRELLFEAIAEATEN